jgi:hypothetical protein
MPFDGANFVISAQDVLEAALSAGGLEPIDPRFLDRHKAEQIRRYPASRSYRYRRALELAQVAMLVAGVVLFLVPFSAHRFAWESAAGLVAFGLGVLSMLVPIKGPARWRERIADDLRGVPAPIRESALRLQRRLPETRFVVGELFQDRITLDPYLLAEYGDARAALGIWDGNRLIACA